MVNGWPKKLGYKIMKENGSAQVYCQNLNSLFYNVKKKYI